MYFTGGEKNQTECFWMTSPHWELFSFHLIKTFLDFWALQALVDSDECFHNHFVWCTGDIDYSSVLLGMLVMQDVQLGLFIAVMPTLIQAGVSTYSR